MCGVRFKRRGDYAKHMREKHSMRPGRDSQSPEPISPPVSGVNNGTSFDMMMMTSTSSSPDDTLRDIPGHRPLSPSSLRRVSLDSGYSSYYTSSMGMANANMHRSREPRRSFDYAPSVMTRPMSAIGHRYQHPYHHSPQHAHHHGQHHPHHYPYHPHHSTGHEMGPADSDSLHRHVMSMDQKHRPAAIAAIIENNGSHGPLSASSSPHYPLAPSHRELPPVRTGSPLEMRDRCASSSILISRPASTNGRDPFLPPLQPHSASQDRFFSSNNYHGVSSPLRPPSVPLPPHLAMPMSASAMGPEPASAHRYNNGYADYGPSGAPPVSWERSRWSPPLRPLSTPAGPSPQQMARPSISSPLTSTLPSFPEARLGQTPMQRHQSSAAVMQKHAHAKEEEHSYYPNEYPSESRDHEMPDSASIAAKSNGQPFHLITKVEAVAPVDPTPRLSCPPRALYRLLHEENVNTSPSAKDTDKSAQLNVPGSGGSSVSKRPRSHTLENMNDPGIHLHPSQRLGIMAPTETSVLVAVDQDTEEDEKMGQETSLYRLFMSLHRTDFDSTLSLRDAKQLLTDLTDRMADWDQVLTVVPSNVMAQIFKQYAQLPSAAESMSFKQMDMVMDKPDTIDASAEPFAFPSVRSGHRLRAYCILDKEEQEHEETERHFLFDVTTKHCKVVELPINTAASSINGRWIDSLRIGMDRSAESK
ncbi:hypothetical protein BDF19DRAFT_438756 [Syncephalis fuscata]|nr:hypothetical protein BDF19DRAFT_438756 [Syncephalis fuscata]